MKRALDAHQPGPAPSVDEIVATVDSIEPRPCRSEDRFDVVLGIATATTGAESSQLLNMLFGNCSLQPEVQLMDVAFPEGYEKAFPGPRFGIDGIRTLARARGRPLTCSALKPQGSSPRELAALARTFALAGLDVIKDDHGIANQAYAPFAERVPAVMEAVAAANRESGGNRRTPLGKSSAGGWRSAIEAAPFLVVEHRRSHLDRDITARHGYIQGLAHSIASATDHRKRNGAFESYAVIGGCNVSERFEGWGESRGRGNLRAFFQDYLRIHRGEPYELLSIGRAHGRPHQ